MTTPLEDLRVLQTTQELADAIWREVVTWKEFTRDTAEKQLARASDSIGANIAEAYGRFHYGEKINLLYYARGSLFETKYWLNRCRTRQLITEEHFNDWTRKLGEIGRQINSFANHLKMQRSSNAANTLRESSEAYETQELQSEILDNQELDWVSSNEPNLEPPLNLQSLISNLQSQ